MEDTILSSSSSSSASSWWKYDVFLSFCGKDTRNNFTDHLYTSLMRNGINTFRDDQNLEKGEDFPPRLLSAIKQSWCAIIVFSKGYAFSRWCLDELVEIVNQKKERGYQVYPIFYDVNPSELRSQKESVAEAFAKHEDRYKENKEKTQTWPDALFEAANISGWDFKKDSSEAKLIGDVVKEISAKLFQKHSPVPDDLIVCKLEENLDALRTEVAELKELRIDVLRRVKIAEDQQQLKRLAQVQGWLLRTETVINEVDLLIAKSPQEIKKLCMGGCCSSNPKSHLKFGKQIAKILQDVKDQKSKGDFEVVADEVPIPLVTRRPSEPTVGLESTLNEVWSSLQEEQVGIIGLYGLGGVGKTTLLNLINNKFHDRPNDFDHVIWAVASQDLQIEQLQEDIGERIGLFNEHWKRKRPDGKAIDIFNVLCKRKFALLLDDVWHYVDLTRVIGVPLPTKENGSKIIFTTRLYEVCCQMGAHEKIKVECLPQAEALKLFEQKVRKEILDRHPDIRKLAKKVVEECAGLPLTLITIGRAMASKKTPEEWEYAIEVLRQSAGFRFPGVGKEMYPKLKFSFDCLPTDTVRSCFLYCSLFPEDFQIKKSELIDCWIGEGFLDVHIYLGRAVRNQGHYIIGCLLDACLLEEDEWNDNFLKMHDVIRDMALWIASESEEDKFFVQAGVRLIEQPEAEKWEKVRRMSLMKNKIENLTETSTCSSLQTLFLGQNMMEVISDDFFKFMRMLRVLDLSQNGKLKKLPIGIVNLVSLEHLNLSHTMIRQLPIELKALKNLKCLNLEATFHLKEIPRHLISSFSKLQVLRMFFYGLLTALEANTEFDNDGWLVEELQSLKYLNLLTISFRSVSTLQNAMRSLKIQNFTAESIVLHRFRGTKLLNILDLATMQHLDFLMLHECEDLEQVKIERAGLETAGCFHSLQQVRISECPKLRDLTWVILAPQLKWLTICDCGDMEQIISEEKLGEIDDLSGNLALFSKLEILSLVRLPQMKSVYRDALPFPQLKRITVEECPKMRKLPLNSDSAKGQKILIQRAEEWWKDLEWEVEPTRSAFLPSFKPLSGRNARNSRKTSEV